MRRKGEEPRGARIRRFGLRHQIVAIMLLCYLLPALVLGLFSRFVLLRGIREKADAALLSESAHAWTMTVQKIDRAVELSKEAVYDEDLALFWEQWKSSAISNAEYLRLSRNYLERKYSRDSLFRFAAFIPAGSGSLFICNPSGRGAASSFITSGLSDTLELAASLDTAGMFTGSGEQLFLVRNLLNLRMQQTGTLILALNRDELFRPFLELGAQREAEVVLQLDRYDMGTADWTGLPEGLTDLPDRETISCVRVTAPGEGYDLRFLLTLSRQKLYGELILFRSLSVLVLLLLLPLLALIILFVRRRITRPIRILADASRRIEAGELGVTVPMRGGDELGELGSAFSNMSLRLRELIEKTYQEEIALRDARIQALQSRINPHFLNNALETINWEARIEGSDTISRMVTALSVLLNATLSRGNRRLVSLREELEVADSYIFFIQQRYGDSFSVSVDADTAAGTCVIPLLTVQPVLENAVDHGIAPAGGGEVRLTARRAGDCLRLTILNTGKPIGPEDRERIDSALSEDYADSSHIGLANIARRLRLLYGGRAEITVRSGPAGETVVEILVPQDEITEGAKL